MPSLEQPPRGKAIKRGGKKVEADIMSGTILPKPKELAVSENAEVTAMKQQVKDLETQISAARGLLKKDLEKELDEVQDKLARRLSAGYQSAEPISPEQHEKPKADVETVTTADINKQKEKRAALKKKLLPKMEGAKDMEEIKREQNEKAEVAASLAELKKLGEEKAGEQKKKLSEVREKIKGAPSKPAEEVFFSNWPKKEEKKPEEKTFTKMEEAWFQEGEQAEKSEEVATKLEETAKKRSSAGLSKKVSSEEPQALKEARKELEDTTKKLEKFGVDVKDLTGGWIDKTRTKLAAGGGLFSKKAREVGTMYDAYFKAKKEVDEMTAPTGSVEKQMMRGIRQNGGGRPGGGLFGKPQ